MAEQHNKYLLHSCVVVAGLLSLVWHRVAYPALAPATRDTPSQENEPNAASKANPRAAVRAAASETIFALPPVRLSGALSYEYRSDWADRQKMAQQGITSTINAKTVTYIWQPWFATLSADVGLSVMRHISDSGSKVNALDSQFSNPRTFTSSNLATTGNIQLSALRTSSFPFQAHITKNDSRVSSSLAEPIGFASQTIGFSQGFATPYGSGSLGFDRNTQVSEYGGKDKQDSLTLSMSKTLGPNQNIQFSGLQNKNTHVSTGEQAQQGNLTVQHRYSPIQGFSLDSMANVSQTDYQLLTGSGEMQRMGSNETRLMQLNSVAFWRPDESPLTVTGGVRMLGLMMSSHNPFSEASSESQTRNANVNVGVNYDFSRAVRMYASANLGMSSGAGTSNRMASESAGISYMPETKQLGDYRYDWSTSANVSNSSGSGNGNGAANADPNSTGGASRSLALQLSHGLSRSLVLSPGSTLSMGVSQGLSSAFRSGGAPVQRITHSGSVSWSFSGEDSSLYLSSSVSDARSLGDSRDSFQMINFQVSSNLPTGRFSSWRGNLTIQSVRQDVPVIPGVTALDIFDVSQTMNLRPTGFVTTSSGSIGYQNMRLFGIPRLRFTSDLRLNSQALLPLLSGPLDRESASWDSTLDYGIGRTRLRMNTRMAKVSGSANKSIMFTATRALGD